MCATVLCRAMAVIVFFFSSRRRHTRLQGDWSSDVCSSDLPDRAARGRSAPRRARGRGHAPGAGDRKSTRLNSSHLVISYAVFCLKKKKKISLSSPARSPLLLLHLSEGPMLSLMSHHYRSAS